MLAGERSDLGLGDGVTVLSGLGFPFCSTQAKIFVFEAAAASQLCGSSLVFCAFPGSGRGKLEFGSLLSSCDQLGLTGTLQLSAEQ